MRQLLVLSFLIMFGAIVSGQVTGQKLNIEIQINSNDHIQQLNLSNYFSCGETVEGYFYIEKDSRMLGGKYKKGGFDFLDNQIMNFSTNFKFQNPDSLRDLDNYLNSVSLDKICAFQIIPKSLNLQTDTLIAIIKYVYYSRKELKNNSAPLSATFDITPHAELIKLSYNRKNPLPFLSLMFPDYSISIKIKNDSEPIYINADTNPLLSKGISLNPVDTKQTEIHFNISCEYIKTEDAGRLQNGFPPRLFNRILQQSLQHFNGVSDDHQGKTQIYGSGIYATDFQFPFHLYNWAKEQLYSKYRMYGDVAQSKISIAVVPASISKDSLTADVYIYYKKMNIDDLQRWTPFKKRVILKKGEPVYVMLPKENWNAVFTRLDEKYEIYGYSDFEKYVNEYVCLVFNSIF